MSFLILFILKNIFVIGLFSLFLTELKRKKIEEDGYMYIQNLKREREKKKKSARNSVKFNKKNKYTLKRYIISKTIFFYNTNQTIRTPHFSQVNKILD